MLKLWFDVCSTRKALPLTSFIYLLFIGSGAFTPEPLWLKKPRPVGLTCSGFCFRNRHHKREKKLPSALSVTLSRGHLLYVKKPSNPPEKTVEFPHTVWRLKRKVFIVHWLASLSRTADV